MITDISLLDNNESYTFANYITWQFKERIELIKGKLFKMTPVPVRKHQLVSGELYRQFSNFLYKKNVKLILHLLTYVFLMAKETKKPTLLSNLTYVLSVTFLNWMTEVVLVLLT